MHVDLGARDAEAAGESNTVSSFPPKVPGVGHQDALCSSK